MPHIIASENWEFAPLVLLILAGLIWMVRFWEGPNQTELVSAEHSPASQPQSPTPVSQPAALAMTNTPENWRDAPSGPWGGPVGPMFALEMVNAFKGLPQPCTVMLTVADDKPNLEGALESLLEYGTNCQLGHWPLNADQSASPPLNDKPGMIVHWSEGNGAGRTIAHFFDSSSINLKVSHRLPTDAPPNLIWIDIGPGSPWK